MTTKLSDAVERAITWLLPHAGDPEAAAIVDDLRAALTPKVAICKDGLRQELIDTLADRIEFWICAEADREDVAKLIDSLGDYGMALGKIPEPTALTPPDGDEVERVARALYERRASFARNPNSKEFDDLDQWARERINADARHILSALTPAPTSGGASEPPPIDMILHCPNCGLQHIDEPDERTPDWDNPPHRSHLCHGCGCIWRPADVPTNGVAAIQTKGKADTWETAPHAPASASDGGSDALVERVALKQAALDLHEAAGRFAVIEKLDPKGCSELTRAAARRADAALSTIPKVERVERGEHVKEKG